MNSDTTSLKLAIWQIYFDKISLNGMDKKFIPYNNTDKLTLFYENEVMLNICKNKKNEFINSDYVGVLSWRFQEKTHLTYADIYNHINNQALKKEVYSLTPTIYNTMNSPYSESGFGNIFSICKIIDKVGLFPFKVTGYNSVNCNKFKSFCNFFICKPEIFEDYVNNYLNKLIHFIQTCNEPEFLYQIQIMIKHRNNIMHPIHPFLLEGLFECYVAYKGYSYEYIYKKTI